MICFHFSIFNLAGLSGSKVSKLRAFILDGDDFLLEAKWQESSVTETRCLLG